jgi:DNA-binding NarL/FixJ family response regulator
MSYIDTTASYWDSKSEHRIVYGNRIETNAERTERLLRHDMHIKSATQLETTITAREGNEANYQQPIITIPATEEVKPKQPYHHLSANDILQIVQLRSEGLTHKVISNTMGISKSTVSRQLRKIKALGMLLSPDSIRELLEDSKDSSITAAAASRDEGFPQLLAQAEQTLVKIPDILTMIRDLVNLTEKLQTENSQWVEYMEELETKIVSLEEHCTIVEEQVTTAHRMLDIEYNNIADYSDIVKAGQEVIDRSTGSET